MPPNGRTPAAPLAPAALEEATQTTTWALVIPAYREAARLGATFDKLAAWRPPRPVEIVIVDDGSDDDTVVICEKEAAAGRLDLRVIALGSNEGKGWAVRAGVLDVTAPIIGFVDADLSSDTDEVERCFLRCEEPDVDVVLASRAMDDSVIPEPQPGLRQLSGRCFNVAVRALGLSNMHDTQCGLKVFRREWIAPLFEPLQTRRFAFDVEVLLRAQRAGATIAEVPITWRHREESRVTPARDGARMLRDIARLRLTLARGRRRQGGTEPAATPSDATGTEMQASTYDDMARLEASHWWFRAKRALVADALTRFPHGGESALDVGCGAGATVELLRERGFRRVVGTDLSGYALGLVKARDPAAGLVLAKAEALPVPDGTLGALTCLDVVEHLDDDREALRELHRAVHSEGLLVVTVPAYQWAWSDHDVALGHRRRYTRSTITNAATDAGFDVIRCTHFHSWLVPPALMLRKTPAHRFIRGRPEEASFGNPLVNRALALVTKAERALLRVTDLPFGLSILLVAKPRPPVV
jgi:dolichyl-phosphate beta-glucosyltransferase